MKVSATLIAAVVAMAAHNAQGFAPSQQLRSQSMTVGKSRSAKTISLKMAEESEIEKLRAAAAKAREEAARLAKVRAAERQSTRNRLVDTPTNLTTFFLS